MNAPAPLPYRITKMELYRFLLRLRSEGAEIHVVPVASDGWHVKVDGHRRSNLELSGMCNAAGVRDGVHYPFSDPGCYLITLDRIGMDSETQTIFDAASRGEWREK